jgi:methionyl aminopeptidase
VLCTGSTDLEPCGDGWGLRLADGGLAVHFEHTLAVFRSRTEVLTVARPMELPRPKWQHHP